jgi:hypothetical protein
MVFCLAGINTADLYDLPLDAHENGVIHYRRKKTRDKSLTGSYTEIRIPEQPLIRRYKNEELLAGI